MPRSLEGIRASRAALLGGLCLAAWPVFRWYVARLTDGSDEPWGLVALVAALIFVPRAGWGEAVSSRSQWLLCGGLAAYAASYSVLPPLARALGFVTGLGLIAGQRVFPLAWWSLLVLSLPFVATLQFYIGYPLRWLTTLGCVPLLRLGGLSVTAEATTLCWAGERVVVDAPCSGLHMVWAGCFLGAVLACWHRFDVRAAIRLLSFAGVVVFVANILRATCLFCFESNLWPSTSWTHEAVGLVAFGLAAVAILAIGERLAARSGRSVRIILEAKLALSR
jgi:exosortase/archaeosortase family protein